MMYFFGPVQTFSTSGKTGKGKAIQEMALRFQNVIVDGDEMTPLSITVEMRQLAMEIDKQFKRGRATFVDITGSDGSGEISGYPVSDVVNFDQQPYFRITFHKVARTVSAKDAVEMAKGGEK